MNVVVRSWRRLGAPWRSSLDQRGFATMEFLAAMVVLVFTVSGILAASFAAGFIGNKGNQEARRNVLMTAFSEAVKALPYEDCTATDGSSYQTAFDNGEAKVPGDEDLRTTTGATLEVENVNVSSTCPATDSGTQSITLAVTIRGVTLRRVIIKRSPDGQLAPIEMRIVNPLCPATYDPPKVADPADPDCKLLRSGANDPQVIIGMQADGSSKIYQYEWWCDAAHPTDDPTDPWLQVNTPSGQEETSAGQSMVTLLRPIPATEPKFVTTTYNDSVPECRYAAPATGSTQHDPPILVLRVTEEGTNRTAMFARKLIPLPTTTTPHNPPIAQIQVNHGGPPQCLQADKCQYNTVITFQSIAPPPPDAAIVQWEWNFGDGTPTQFCTPTPPDPTGALCKDVQHTYIGGSPPGGYPVSLVVTDGWGTRSTDPARNVVVDGPQKIRPTIKAPGSAPSVTATPSSSPVAGISPQTITFDASGSYADGYTPGSGTPPGGIVNYYWDFGTGNALDNQSGATLTSPTFTYPKSNTRVTYTVTVTVTDVNGLTNFATVPVVLDPLVPPIGIANNGAHKGDVPFFRNAYFDFQWTNVPRSPGDTIKYVIRIRSAGGFCGFFGVGGYRDFTVNGGAAGTPQSYRAQFSSSPAGFNGVCATDRFNFQAQTIRTNPACAGEPGGVCTSDWSALQPLDPEFF